MSDTPRDEATVPLVDERLVIEKRTVQTGRVRVKTVVDERQQGIEESLESQDVSVERVVIDRVVDSMPEPHQDGDVLVIPVVEEILVIEKRFRLKEELRIRTVKHFDKVQETVTLKSTRAVIERQ